MLYNNFTGRWVDQDCILIFTEDNIQLCRGTSDECARASITEAVMRSNEDEITNSWDDGSWKPRPGDLVLANDEICLP